MNKPFDHKRYEDESERLDTLLRKAREISDKNPLDKQERPPLLTNREMIKCQQKTCSSAEDSCLTRAVETKVANRYYEWHKEQVKQLLDKLDCFFMEEWSDCDDTSGTYSREKMTNFLQKIKEEYL